MAGGEDAVEDLPTGWLRRRRAHHAGLAVALVTAHYPPADLTPGEFEEYLTSLFDALDMGGAVGSLRVQTHEVVSGADGTYDFDATVRYELGGMDFLIVVEAKRHKNPIKRELVQVLHQKFQSVGGQKAVLVSTVPFQHGALDFALVHGVALVTVTEGRFTFQTRSSDAAPPPSEVQAHELGLATLVGYAYGRGEQPGSITSTIVSPEYPEYLAGLLLP
ncbi:MAG: restriction endonuclease [Actinomycetales bacterium]|nr:restriction endonuclease [Actinomycetales bacterium]